MRKEQRDRVARETRARRNLLLSIIPALSIAASCGATDAATVISSLHVSATVVATCDIPSVVAPVRAKAGTVCAQATADPAIALPKPVITYSHDDAAGVTWETIAF